MPDTQIRVLDDSIHTSNEWLKELAEMLHVERESAYKALRGYFHTVRDCIDIRGARSSHVKAAGPTPQSGAGPCRGRVRGVHLGAHSGCPEPTPERGNPVAMCVRYGFHPELCAETAWSMSGPLSFVGTGTTAELSPRYVRRPPLPSAERPATDRT